ncbi:MAG: GNAT family N-acetyltransferase [Chloroflexota bacterium]
MSPPRPARDPARQIETRRSFVVSRLSRDEVERYKAVTGPLDQSPPARLPDSLSLVAVGATRFGRPIGLALAELSPDGAGGREGAVRWLFVRPGYRQIGVGTALLAALEQALTERGCRQVRLSWPSDAADPGHSPAATGRADPGMSPATDALARLLGRHGWIWERGSTASADLEPAPRVLVKRLYGDAASSPSA